MYITLGIADGPVHEFNSECQLRMKRLGEPKATVQDACTDIWAYYDRKVKQQLFDVPMMCSRGLRTL